MVMVQPVVMEFPDDVAVPVEFENAGRFAIETLQPANCRQRVCAAEQIAIFQQVGIRDAELVAPAMAEPALHVYEVGRSRTTATEQGVSPETEIGFVVDQAGSVLVRSCHVVPGILFIRGEVSMVECDRPSRPGCKSRDPTGTRDCV